MSDGSSQNHHLSLRLSHYQMAGDASQTDSSSSLVNVNNHGSEDDQVDCEHPQTLQESNSHFRAGDSGNNSLSSIIGLLSFSYQRAH